MTITRLAPVYQGRVLVPVLGPVTSTRYTDQISVRLVSGQSPKDFADQAAGLAHGFRARRVPGPLRTARHDRPGISPP